MRQALRSSLLLGLAELALVRMLPHAPTMRRVVFQR